jgi:hypothetical protein
MKNGKNTGTWLCKEKNRDSSCFSMKSFHLNDIEVDHSPQLKINNELEDARTALAECSITDDAQK